jgi:anthranilate phosphoribosyltransferase
MNQIEELINSIEKGKNLSFEESKTIFINIMGGQISEDLIFKFLTGLSIKGETSDEIAGGVYVLREKALKVKTNENIIDTCGTGGDGKSTLNISTASALLLASMGTKVAKHGNKALSSKCGSADVLERLKINIHLKPDGVAKSIEKNNFGFMFAPNYHLTMKYVAPIRKKIAKRTIFNLLGPLSSPANVKKQLIGVFSKNWLVPFANALKSLNCQHVWIVHSEDGMDEISPFAKTNILEVKNGKVNEFIIDPQKIGIEFKNPNNLIGQDANYNANKIIDIFSGSKNEFSEAVCLNAAGALIIDGKFKSFFDAYEYSKNYLKSDKTLTHLKKIQTF